DCAYADVLLDELFVMDRALSDAQVAGIYQNGIPDPGATGVTATSVASALTLRQAASGGTAALHGRMTLAEAATTLDLVQQGVTLELLDTGGTVLYRVDVPGGSGWTKTGRTWRYGGSGTAGGVRAIAVTIPKKHPNLVRFTVKVKDGPFAVPSGPA